MIRSLLTFVALAPTLSANAGDWSQFKGPNATGVSPEKNLPLAWSKDKGIKWKTPLPARGVSSPVVAGNKVYVTCSSGVRDDRLHVLCFDATTGKQLWHRQLQGTGGTSCHPKTCMASNTPVADETGVYALFATADLAAFDADGTLRWYRSLVGDYPTISNQVGMASSPVLVKDRLIVPMDNSGESFIAAVDIKYGKNLWKVERPRDINWVTPLVREIQGKTEILFSGSTGLISYDAANGDRRWSYKPGVGTIPTAALDGDALFLPIAGVSKVKLNDSGVVGEPQWKSAGLQNTMASPLVYSGRVYAANGQGFICCANAKTGKELFKERAKGAFSASPIAGDGKIYCFNETGVCTVLKANTDEFDVLATNDLGEEILGTPAIANGLIFIRTDKAVYAIGK